MAEIPIFARGSIAAIALVSAEDAEWAASIHWTLSQKGYARRRTPRHEFMHRAVLARALGRDLLPREQVHHGPGGRLDNRRANLTLCASHQEHKAQHFEHPGVRWDRQRRRWIARPTIAGRKLWLGRHESREAALAAVEAVR